MQGSNFHTDLQTLIASILFMGVGLNELANSAGCQRYEVQKIFADDIGQICQSATLSALMVGKFHAPPNNNVSRDSEIFLGFLDSYSLALHKILFLPYVAVAGSRHTPHSGTCTPRALFIK